MFTPIEDRLTASLKYDAINGDASERAVVESQIREAIKVIKELRRQAGILLKGDRDEDERF